MTRGVQLVRPDNFTPPSRTPWGGRRIVREIKAGLGLDLDADAPVGESWEISVEPSFPTAFESGDRLTDAITADPVWWLGPEIASRDAGCPLLVKLVDAAADLSVQVHPREDDVRLGEGDSGKTEAWVVLAADPGARILLGFRDGVGPVHVARCARDGGRLDELMNEVAVATGEVYFIPPGLAHALGAGVTVLEPQRVRPGCRSITYRFWDWNRRYDSEGRPSAGGAPRPLHLDEALAVTDWTATGANCVDASRRRPVLLPGGGGAGRWHLLDETALYVERWTGSGEAALPELNALLGILCVMGSAEITDDAGTVPIRCGQTALVPAGATDLTARLASATIYLCSARPDVCP